MYIVERLKSKCILRIFRSYGHLAGLVGVDPVEDSGESLPEGTAKGRSDSTCRIKQKDMLPALPQRGDLCMPPRTGDSESKIICLKFVHAL